MKACFINYTKQGYTVSQTFAAFFAQEVE